MDDLLQEFITETNESLSALDGDLLRLEKNPGDKELIGRVFRLVHTVKGNCGFLNLPRLENVAHHAENVLGQYRSGAATATPDSVSLIFQSLDRIRGIVAGLEASGQEPPGDDGALISLLDLAGAGQPAPVGSTAAAPAPSAAAVTVRINLSRVEDIMTTTGELVLARNRLLQALESESPEAIKKAAERLNIGVSTLQSEVMGARMQPVGSAWTKFPRLLRDAAIDLGKKIRLELVGEETVLDRQVLELIRDPLTHLIRNAADHGIETPAARAFAGKPVEGTVRLAARQEGGQVIIEVSDDGRGIDVDNIRRKVLEKNLLPPEKLQAMTPEQLRRLVFLPGFSTAATVTALSGRGVGMDVVRDNIEKIGGIVDLRSQPGAGTTISLRLPLTLAIVPALIVSASAARYALPQAAVLEILKPTGMLFDRAGEAQLLHWRGADIPLLPLRQVFETPAADRRGNVIVLSSGGKPFAIEADAVHTVEDIVVKPLPPVFRRAPFFSGSAVLGDGGVVFILDAAALALRAGITAGEAEQAEPVVAPTAPRRPYLVYRRSPVGAPQSETGAVPLDQVFRLEKIDAAAVQHVEGRPVLPYRGGLLPLTLKNIAAARQRLSLVILQSGGRQLGMAVDDILDIIDAPADMPAGQAMLSGRAVSVLNAAVLFEGGA